MTDGVITWEYRCQTLGNIHEQVMWCKREFGSQGDRWWSTHYEFIPLPNHFCFHHRDDYALFALTWADDMIESD